MYLELYWVSGTDPQTGDPIVEIGQFQIRNLSYAPQVDLTGNSLTVNEYSVDVITHNAHGDMFNRIVSCNLFDDSDQLWSAWPLYKAVRVSESVMRVTCRSWINELETLEMEETVYAGQTAETVMATIFPNTIYYTLANALKDITISGYAPAQTARERLTWVLFAIGGFVRDVYTEQVDIVEVDNTEALIPFDHTYMRPSIIDKADWVTALKVTSYSFLQASSDEEAAQYDNSYMFPLPWVATEEVVTLLNPDAPDDAPENVVEINGIYLVNSGNVSDISSRLALYWFNPLEASLDCINNRQYRPGDLVDVYLNQDEMLSGYIQQASYSFGKQSRSSLRLVGCEVRASDVLTVNYLYDGQCIVQNQYRFPVGFGYELSSRYLEHTVTDPDTQHGHRLILRPVPDTIAGTMVSGGVSVDIACEIALDYDMQTKTLTIVSVDAVTTETEDGKVIGVID